MADAVIQDVSDTAFMVATYRALEGERPSPLFRDPLAGRLAGEHGRRIVAGLGRGVFLGGWSVVLRTCIIDDYIQAAIAGGVTVIVNLGAGLDTRPYRMALPDSLQWIEVDFPHVMALKERELAGEQPRCRLERVKLDLTQRAERQRLLTALNRRGEKVLVLTEGVVPYLSVEEAASLADDLQAQEHFVHWIVDYFSSETLRWRRRQAVTQAMQNAPFKFEPPDWFGFFKQHGWSVKQMRYIPDEARRLKRPIPLPLAARLGIRVMRLFMSAARREALRKFSGYALMERAAS